MEHLDKEQIKRIRRAVRVVFPDLPKEFTTHDLIMAVKAVMGDGYVYDGSITRRLRELFSSQYEYDKIRKVYIKNDLQLAA